MLEDAKLNSFDTHLEQFKLSDQTHHQDLQALLRDHSRLLEEYKILKNSKSSELPKSNGAASTIPTPALNKPHNPYVLVLVDGNGYLFNDELVKDKSEGGMRTAHMLNEVVEKFLRKQLQATRESRIVVRVYADITDVSKKLAKIKVVGLEKRSLMPFAAGFTRAVAGFDFVDTLNEEGTKIKIQDAFKFAIEDPACSHILFAACHDSSYVPQLVSYISQQNKITLVGGSGFDSEFYRLDLTIAQFPTIFRQLDLPTAPSTSKSSLSIKESPTKASISKISALDRENWRQGSSSVKSTKHDSDSAPIRTPDFTNELPTKAAVNEKSKLCRYFQKGYCRWGSNCNFIHALDNATPGVQNPSASATATATVSGVERKNVSIYLPTTIPNGMIGLNKDSHRLDVYIPPPTPDEWFTYNARFHKQKPCNAHHLSGTCTNFNCPFDHHPLEVGTQHCLEYVLKCKQCPRKGACRDKDCFQGHICQKDGCTGLAKGCKLRMEAHLADPKLVSMVPAVSVENATTLLIDVDADEGAYEGSW